MSGTAIRSSDAPVPAEPRSQPFGAASGPWRAPSLLPTDPGAMHVEEAPGPAGEWMLLLIPLARGDVTPQGDDLRIAIQRLPPPLMPPALHAFFTFECCHGCPPSALP